MENNDQSGKFGNMSSGRQRRSIFGTEKPKPDIQEPKILLNGDTFDGWNVTKASTGNSFYQPSKNSNSHVTFTRPVHVSDDVRTSTGSFFVPPENSMSRTVIGSPSQSSCVRPSSVGRTSPVMFQNQAFNAPWMGNKTQSRIITGPVPSNSVLTSSKYIPSQSNNLLSSIIINPGPSQLKRKHVTFDAAPHESIIRHSPIKQQIIQTLTEIPQPTRVVIQDNPTRVVIQDNPKTLSEINKLSSLNQYLSQQYNLVNNELHSIKNKTYLKDVVNDFEFLEKSQNRIDDIFIRETNQALMKLDEISRCSSSKGFSRGSNSRIRRSPSPGSRHTNQTSQQYYMTAPLQQNFTPVKIVQQMQNSSYVPNSSYGPCHHIDPMSVYDEQV